MLERAVRPTEARAAPHWEAPSGLLRVSEEVRGAPEKKPPWSGGARRAGARPCVSARGAPRITIPKELTEECLWGGSAPPNGSRLSCGRPACRRKSSGRQSVPARARHSDSLRAITARQLQALVRRRVVQPHAGESQLIIHGVPNWSVSTPNRRAQ